MAAIHFILTGGTVEKLYDPVSEKPQMMDESIVTDYLKKKIKPHASITSKIVCMKDSLDLTNKDRSLIAKAVKNAKAKQIVIVHGTSTMTTTAEFLQKQKNLSDKIIVLVGAMIPLREFAMSDAGFNLGYAVAQVQNLKPGVYICMNARTFKAGEVVKNKKRARFEKK